jgi:hypothetical protein
MARFVGWVKMRGECLEKEGNEKYTNAKFWQGTLYTKSAENSQLGMHM